LAGEGSSRFIGISDPRHVKILAVKGGSSNNMLIFGFAKTLGTKWENE